MSTNNFNKASNTILTLRDKKQKQLVLLDHYIRAEENIGRMKFPELNIGEFYFSLSQASDYLECERMQVCRLMKQLENLGVITVIELSKSRHKPSKYRYNTYVDDMVNVTVEPSNTNSFKRFDVTVNDTVLPTVKNVTVNDTVNDTVNVTVNPNNTNGLEESSVMVDVTVNDTVNVTSKKELLKKNNKKNIYIVQSESLWKLYPNKTGKAQAIKKIPKLIEQYGYEQLERCIQRYIKGLEIDTWRKPQAGSTFFNSGHVDYLDDNYEEPKPQPTLKVVQPIKQPKNARFTVADKHGHNWDFAELERLEQEYIERKLRGEV